jgi:hypothetical protein
VDEARVGRLLRDAKAERWGVTSAMFAPALERSAAKAFAGRHATDAERDRFFQSLISRSRAGLRVRHNPDAWTSSSPSSARSYAAPLTPSIQAVSARGGRCAARQLFSRSLFRYFHGRSTLATWLRSLDVATLR